MRPKNYGTYPHKVGTLENGWILASDGTVIRPSAQTTGSITFSNASISGKVINEWYHSHPGGGSAIPSLADFKALAQRYQEGYIKADDFSYGIVSEYGCMSLIITSGSNFGSFATKLRSGELDAVWKRIIIDAPVIDYTTKMGRLLLFFQDNNAGTDI